MATASELLEADMVVTGVVCGGDVKRFGIV